MSLRSSDDVYALASRLAELGDARGLDDVLRDNPGLMSSAGVLPLSPGRYGFLADVLRSGASNDAVRVALNAFLRELPGNADFLQHAFVSCYATRLGFLNCRFEFALTLLDNTPESKRPMLVQCGLPRWTATTNAFINSHTMYTDPTNVALGFDIFCMPLCRHLRVVKVLVEWSKTIDRHSLDAVCGLAFLLEMWSKVERNRHNAGVMLEAVRGVVENMLRLRPRCISRGFALARSANCAGMQVGFHHTPGFVLGPLQEHTYLLAPSALMVCAHCDWQGMRPVRHLRSLLALQGMAPDVFGSSNHVGSNVYGELVLKVVRLQFVTADSACMQHLLDIFSKARVEDLLCPNLEAKSPIEHLAMSITRMMPYHDGVADLDGVLLRFLRVPAVEDALACICPHNVRVCLLTLVRHGFLHSAVSLLRSSFRRAVRVEPGCIGVSSATTAAYFEMCLTSRSGGGGYKWYTKVFGALCSPQRLSVLDHSDAVSLAALMPPPIPRARDLLVSPFFRRNDQATPHQRGYVKSVFCAAVAAHYRWACPYLPPEVVLHILGCVRKVDLGHYSGTFL